MFWNSQGVTLSRFSSITAAHYANLISKLREIVKVEERSEDFDLFEHPPYSPDLPPTVEKLW